MPHQLLISPILKKPSTHMPDLLRIILLRCLALSSTELQSMKLVLYMVLLLGRFSSSNPNSRCRKVVYLPLCCFLVRRINIKDKITAKIISLKHYPQHLFTVTISNIIRALPPHRHHLNLQVLHLLPPTLTPFRDQAHYSYANLFDALNRTATRVINKLTA